MTTGENRDRFEIVWRDLGCFRNELTFLVVIVVYDVLKHRVEREDKFL